MLEPNRLSRHVEGEEHPFHILTEDDVRDMRYLRRVEGWPYTWLAYDYGVHPLTVRAACIGVTWRCVTDEPFAPSRSYRRAPEPELRYRILSRTVRAGGSG